MCSLTTRMLFVCFFSHTSPPFCYFFFFFFNDTATTEIYTLSLHDALPIFPSRNAARSQSASSSITRLRRAVAQRSGRSEEHTSELQSRENLVCRLLLEKKKRNERYVNSTHIPNANYRYYGVEYPIQCLVYI